jgi:DNA-binding IclR family transcriptional regulator
MARVPAAAEAAAILCYLARQAGPVPAGAVSRDLGLPRSTTYHLLSTLQDSGLVVHLPEDRRYALGLAAYELGTGYLRQAPLQRLARVPLASLVDRTGFTGHLGVLHGREVLYVIEERARGRPSLVTDVDVRLPASLTASGRAILAALPGSQVRALFAGPGDFVVRTGAGPRSPSALRAALIETRRTGYAVEREEITKAYSSVAAAVCDHTGHPIAAVALTFPDHEVDRQQLDVLASKVVDTANRISRRIGGAP